MPHRGPARTRNAARMTGHAFCAPRHDRHRTQEEVVADVTVIITPRDRYTGIAECIGNVYACTPQPFKLLVLDAGYPAPLRRAMEQAVRGRSNAEIVPVGRVIPM